MITSLLTVCFISAVGTVALPITQKAFWNAAGFIIAAMAAALGVSKTIEFIRTILTVRIPITDPFPVYTHLSMCTLKLVWKQNHHILFGKRTSKRILQTYY